MKIKVVYIVSTLLRSGPVNQLKNIIFNLNLSEFSPVIITLSPENNQFSMIEDFKKCSELKIISINLSRIKGLFLAKTNLEKELKNISPDIVHTTGIRADSLRHLLGSKYRFITTIRNYPFHDYIKKFGHIKGFLMARKHFRIIKNNRGMVACSKSIADIFEERHGLELKYIANGVDTERYRPISQESKNQIRAKLNIGKEVKVFISVGSIIPRKDPQTIIKAFTKLKDKLSDFRLFFAGSGFLMNECVSLAKNNKEITFLGNISNVDEYLKAADYFVSASHSEGLPNTVLEAMSSGLPPILSKIPSHYELLGNYEQKFMFDIGDTDQLIKQIMKIVDEDYYQLSKNYTDLIDVNFSARLMSQKYQRLYKDMINEVKKDF